MIRFASAGTLKSLNPVTVLEKYSIPRVEDLFTKLCGAKKFSKLGLKDAYLQAEMDEV